MDDVGGSELVRKSDMAARATDTAASNSSREDEPTLLSVDEARERILTNVSPLPLVRMPAREARGLVLGEDVIADVAVPPFANSAMDGYAVRADDTRDASDRTPVMVPIVGEAKAGHPATVAVEPGTAVRIMTGAMVPVGADAVVRFEDTDEVAQPRQPVAPGSEIGIRRAVIAGQNIRAVGEDIRVGDTVLERGTVVRPAEIAVLATLNRTHVKVHRRPEVAILATGDEIVEPGEALGPGQIWNSNSAMIASMVEAAGGQAHILGIARDLAPDLRAKLRAERGADLLITTGGVSVGDYDLVKQVLRAEGEIDFWQVRMKPGKPLAFGHLDGTPLLGLPGNPVAAAVAFEQFARPAIRRMIGRRDVLRPVIQVRLAERVDNAGERRQYLRVRVEADADGFVASLAGFQGSSTLTSLARANGLLIVPETVPVANPGDVLSVQMLDWDA